MKRAILFDFDQTLVDFPATDAARDAADLFREGATRCYAFLSAHERSLPTFEAFFRQQRWIHRRIDWLTRLTGGEPDFRRFLRRMCRDYGLQRDQVSLATLGWLWYEPLTARATVAPDVIPTLSSLANANIELGLAVNSAYPGAVIDRHLESLGLLEFFPVRAYSTDIGARKPDPRLFNAALEAMKVTTAETIYVGDDLKSDIAGAKRVGLTTVLRGPTKSAAKSAAADHTIQQIGELLNLPELEHVRTHAKPKPPAIPALIT